MTINWKEEAEEWEEKYDRLSNRPPWGLLWLIVFLIASFSILITILIVQDIAIDISQETADDVCKQLIEDESAVAEDAYGVWMKDLDAGKLLCITPSFDATQNIVIKSNKEE